jgi:hypothetical protein
MGVEGRREKPMEPENICPPWWPHLLWRLHIPLGLGREKPPSPVNYPPALNAILSSLAIHTLSYLMPDQKAAQQIRTSAEGQIIDTVGKLSSLHEQG